MPRRFRATESPCHDLQCLPADGSTRFGEVSDDLTVVYAGVYGKAFAVGSRVSNLARNAFFFCRLAPKAEEPYQGDR